MDENTFYAIQCNEEYFLQVVLSLLHVIKEKKLLSEEELDERHDEILDSFMNALFPLQVVKIPMTLLVECGIAKRIGNYCIEPDEIEYLYNEILSNYDEEDAREAFDGCDD